MPSQIKVDEIKNVAGQYKIKTNTLEGQTAANNMTINSGNITVKGEGTGTTNLQQGLNKSWINFNGTGTIASRDSFNVSSLADNNTGMYTVTFASNMANSDYATGGGSGENSQDGGNRMLGLRLRSTSVRELRSFSVNSSATDNAEVTCVIAGDLA